LVFAARAPPRPRRGGGGCCGAHLPGGAPPPPPPTTRSDEEIRASRGKSERRGILIGAWDEAEFAGELWSAYRGEHR